MKGLFKDDEVAKECLINNGCLNVPEPETCKQCRESFTCALNKRGWFTAVAAPAFLTMAASGNAQCSIMEDTFFMCPLTCFHGCVFVVAATSSSDRTSCRARQQQLTGATSSSN